MLSSLRVTADEAYGQAKYLQFWPEQHDLPYVLATRVNDTLITTDMRQARADELIAALLARAWQRLSVGAGAHGPSRVPLGAGADLCPLGNSAAGTGCSPAARSPDPTRSPSPSATDPDDPPWSTWPGSPAPADASRNAQQAKNDAG